MTAPHASFKRRMAALAYESLLMAAVTCLAFIPAAAANGLLHQHPPAARTAVGLIFLACWWLYLRLCIQRQGQTLPQRVWQIRLTDTLGNRPDTARLRLRFMWSVACIVLLPLAAYWLIRANSSLPARSVAALALCWWILPWGFALIHPSRQFLYDFLAGTRLVRDTPPSR